MTVIQDLAFGRFAMMDNTSQHSLTVTENDDITSDPEIAYDTPPQRGEYQLEGFTPLAPITIDATNGTMSLNGGGGGTLFTVDDFTNNSPVADNSGEATLYIGATMRTSGDGSHYSDGSYSGTYDMIISW